MIDFIDSFSFDDMMLIPKYSSVMSRDEVDLSVTVTKGFKFSHPIVPSNMTNITELDMARLMYQSKALAVLHRFIDFNKQLEWLQEIKSWSEDALNYIGFSIGVKDADYINASMLVDAGAKIICIDVAHGHSEYCRAMTAYIANKYPQVLLIAGNAAMGDGAAMLWKAGADIVKIGVGNGSICTTRLKTGNGIPILSALSDCADMRKYMEVKLGRKLFAMSDGGFTCPGDLVKSLCFIDLCMTGNLLSATSLTPGDIVEFDNIKYKSYVGSSTHRGNHTEGVKAFKKYKGSTEQVIQELSEGIKSGCSYQNVKNLDDLKRNPKFVRITAAGLKESGAHDLDIIVKE